MADNDIPSIWPTICKALGTEFREHNVIRGASGLEHSVQAIGVDDVGKRLLLVSAEYNPRIAALMRVDVQATMPSTRVLVARPISIDLAHLARKFFLTASGLVDFNKILELKEDFSAAKGESHSAQVQEKYGAMLDTALSPIMLSRLPPLHEFVQIAQQSAMLNWERLFTVKDDFGLLFQNALTELISLDNLATDREHGICPIPTYEFSEDDWTVFTGKVDVEEASQRLKQLNIYQYFYPPADSLALGLIDHGRTSRGDIECGIGFAERDGHQVAKSDLVPDALSIIDMLEELKAMGYAAESEYSYELTEAGESVRKSIRIRPSEGIFSKIVSRFKFNVDVSSKDFFC